MADEVAEQRHRIDAATLRQQHCAEALTTGRLQATLLAEPLRGIGGEHFAPDIGVVVGVIAARKCVRKISAVIARRDLRHVDAGLAQGLRSEEHTSELQSLMRISYAVFCLKKKKK